MQIPEATKLPFRAEQKGEFSTTIMYTLPGVEGIYRRVSREGRASVIPGDGNVLAIIPAGTRDGEPVGGLCELRRWTEGEKLLESVLHDTPKPF